MTAYLGIDIGTYESKGVLVDGDGRILATAVRAHKLLVPEPGFAEHRPEEDWWGDFCAISRDLIATSGIAPADIRAVAASAIGPCMLPVGPDGEPLTNGVLYNVDSRSVREIADVTADLGEDRILERCGTLLSAQSVGPKILWLKRNRPEIYAAADRFHTSTTFLVRRLTGETVVDHYSAASFGPLYDIGDQRWADDLARGIVEVERLPELRWSTEIVGAVTERAAAETGLAAGTPVTAGTIDAAAEAISAGVLSPGDMMLMYGSSTFVIGLTETRVREPRLYSAPWLFPGQHAAMAGHATSGTITRWFRDQFARDLDGPNAMAALAAEAATSPPGARGILCLPYLSGAQTPLNDTAIRAAFFGIDVAHTRADMIRAVLEGVAYATRHILDTFEEAGARPAKLFAVGGGTRNEVWIQAVSDVLERPQAVPSLGPGASYGDAFLAALAVGDVSIDDMNRWNPVGRTVAPAAERAPLYRRGYRAFRTLQRHALAVAHGDLDGEGT